MPLVKVKPTSPGRRSAVRVVTPDLHKGAPHAPLLEASSWLDVLAAQPVTQIVEVALRDLDAERPDTGRIRAARDVHGHTL